MDINQLDNIIRKVPLSKRLEDCQNESKDRISANAPIIFDNEVYKTRPTNYELEIIAFRSVINSPNEYYRERKTKWLLEAAKPLRKHDFFNIETLTPDDIASRLMFMQLEPQINYNILYYRYNYFFNYKTEDLDMKLEFQEKFGVSYNSFVNISICITAFISAKEYDLFKFMLPSILNDEEKKAIKNITSTHRNILEKHKVLTSNLSNTRNQFFDLNLLMQFPIIEHNGQNYIPYVPYIPYACTRSLMFRLTEENENLRRKIGKTVLENYLEYLISNSPVTNKFKYKREFKYTKNKKDSSDLIIYSDDKVVFIEAKLFNQSLKLRSLEESEIIKTHERVSDAIIQILRNFVDMKKGEMNNHLKTYSEENTYGIVLLYDDLYFNTNETYEIAFKKSVEKGFHFTKQQIENMVKVHSLLYFENKLNLYGGDIFQLLEGIELKSNIGRLINYDSVVKSLMNFDENDIRKRLIHNGVIRK